MNELFNHTRPFNSKKDLLLTEIEDTYGESPTMTPDEAKSIGQANKSRKEAVAKREEIIIKDRIIERGNSPTMQWWNQFNKLAVLEKTGLREIGLWAANNTYMITYMDLTGTKLSTEFNSREEAMFAYQCYKMDKKYIKWIRFEPSIKIPLHIPPSPG